MFAMEYFKAAMNLPIIMDIFAFETEARLQRSKRIIRCFHVCFGAIVVVWVIL